MNKQVLTLLLSVLWLTSCKKKKEELPERILKNATEIVYTIKSDSLNQESLMNYVAYTPSDLRLFSPIKHENYLTIDYRYVIEKPDKRTVISFSGRQALLGGNTVAHIMINKKIVAEYVSPKGPGVYLFNLSYQF